MPIGTPEGFLDITNATLRTSVVGISNTGPTGELSVGSNLHVDTTASNVLQVVGNVSSHHMTLGEVSLVPAHGLENVTEVGNTTPYTVSFSNATTGLATTSNLHVGGSLKVGVIDFFNPGLTLATVTNNSNVTPYTVDLRNATTGLVTTSNVVVGGDLIVGGTSLVNAIYPVGAVIDRATAITDTHLNGKYKAFLAAPNQEWELVSSPSVAIGDVSFLVHNTSSSNYDIPVGGSIAWNGVKTNIGGGFQTTGTNINKFVAPVSGNYMFGVYITHRDTNCELTLYVDGVATRDIMAGKDDNRDSTYNVLVPLSANNVVDLRARITTLTIYSTDNEHSQNAWFGFNVGPGTPAITNYSYKRTL